SMAFEQPWPDSLCPWGDCEVDGAAGQSRINVARRVINKVVEQAGESATFGLMTFGMAEPPKSSAQVPYKCEAYYTGQEYRFTWVTYTNQPNAAYWSPLYNTFG